jgi:hypothetical protein
MSNPIRIAFELDNTQPEWLYWLVIMIGDTPVAHIAKNHNVDKQYLLTIYKPRFRQERVTYAHQFYFDTVGECKEKFFSLPVGDMLAVTSKIEG